MTRQILTVSVHDPRVESVVRLPGDPQNRLVVTFGNGEYHGHVSFIVSEEQWNANGMAVSAFLDSEEESIPGCSCGMADYGAPGHGGHDETRAAEKLWAVYDEHGECIAVDVSAQSAAEALSDFPYATVEWTAKIQDAATAESDHSSVS